MASRFKLCNSKYLNKVIICSYTDFINILGGIIPSDAPRSESLYLRHYRYYYDPPEFKTVITTTDTSEDSKLMHLGYFRLDK